MRYTLRINQVGILELGLLGKVDVSALCLLDYVRGWFFCKNAKRVSVGDKEFVWLQAEHAVEELPLLFNPNATVESRRNQLCRLFGTLRKAGLIESTRVGRDLYVRYSDLAVALFDFRKTAAKQSRTLMPSNDNSITIPYDKTLISSRDNTQPTIINEQNSSQKGTKETPPLIPPPGDVGCTISLSLQAEKIYSVYPRKVGQPAALSAILRALARYPFQYILDRTRLFAKSYNGPVQFIPNPATFFRQERFADDPATWQRTNPANPIQRPMVIKPGSFQSGVQKF